MLEVAGEPIFSTNDLVSQNNVEYVVSGYLSAMTYQITVHGADRRKDVFTVKHGLYLGAPQMFVWHDPTIISRVHNSGSVASNRNLKDGACRSCARLFLL